MIIQKIDNKNNIGIKSNQNVALSMPKLILPNKNVDTKDFLYHYPIAQKPMVSFGHNIEKASSFGDSLKKYFQPLPEGCKYDKKQIEAASIVYNGDDPVTVFPTGTGKTAITEYTIAKNMAEGKDTICTFPIKALSNEKYEDFCNIFGKENVGLLTGDIKENADAPIKLMTTEIYRNMLYGDNRNALRNLASVVHDEIHTMNDLERGEVYETAIMKTPARIQQVFLSGTVENGQEFTDWLNNIQAQKNEEEMVNCTKKAVLVEMSSAERHIPLKFMIYDKENNRLIPLMTEKYNLSQIAEAHVDKKLNSKQIDVLKEIAKLGKQDETVENGIVILSELVSELSGPLDNLEKDLQEMLGLEEMKAKRMAAFLSDPAEKRFNFAELKGMQTKNNKARKTLNDLSELADIELINDKAVASEENKSYVKELAKLLDYQDKTPAIIFKLSKKGCNEAQEETRGFELLTKEQRKEVSRITKEFQEQGKFLGTDFDEKSLISGSATHHAGKMPDYKKLVETLAREKLARVTHATSTLEKGINLPSRTTVMTQLDKFSGFDPNGSPIFVDLSINEIHQMMGRAGRRGKDEIGNAILIPDERHSPAQIFKIVTSNPDKIESRLRPTHSFVSNFLEAEGSDKELDKIVDRSFLAQQVLSSKEPHPEKRLDKMKQNFKRFATMLQQPQLECFKKTENGLVATAKGLVVARARGIDGLYFAETLLKAPLADLTPSQLAAMACYLSDGDDKNKLIKIEGSELPAIAEKTHNQAGKKLKIQTVKTDADLIPIIENIEGIKESIKNIENRHNIVSKEIVPNLQSMEFMQKWAESPMENTLDSWQTLVRETVNGKLDEGDLFKSVNSTADILKQMQEATQLIADESKGTALEIKMLKLAENAAKAFEMIKKNPIAEMRLAKSFRI